MFNQVANKIFGLTLKKCSLDKIKKPKWLELLACCKCFEAVLLLASLNLGGCLQQSPHPWVCSKLFYSFYSIYLHLLTSPSINPHYYCRRNPKEPLWSNGIARKRVRHQRKLYDAFKRTGIEQDRAKYKLAKRENKKVFRKMESGYYNRVLFTPLSNGHSKPFYLFYKRKSGRNNQSSVLFKDKTAFETSEIFNSYFQSVFTKVTSSMGNTCSDNKSLITATIEEVEKMLKAF